MSKTLSAQEIDLGLVAPRVEMTTGIPRPAATEPQASRYHRQPATGGGQWWWQAGAGNDDVWDQMMVMPRVFNAKDFGCIGNGVANDGPNARIALAAVIAAGGGVLYFPPGTYNLDNNGGHSLLLDGIASSNVWILGAGPATILNMVGNALAGAWNLLLLRNGVQYVRVSDIALMGSGITNPSPTEQNHLIDANGAANRNMGNFRFENIYFRYVVGDAIRIVGLNPFWTEFVWIINCHLQMRNGILDARSGIHIQRRCRYVIVRGNYVTGVGDQAVELEPSGGGGGNTLDDIIFCENIVEHDSPTVSTLAVFRGIDQTTLANRMIVADNIFVHGAVDVRYVGVFDYVGNIQDHTGYPLDAGASLTITGVSARLRCVDNHIVREPDLAVTGGDTHALWVNYLLIPPLLAPEYQIYDGNHLSVRHDRSGTKWQSPRHITVSNNLVLTAGNTPGDYYGLIFRAVEQTMFGVTAVANLHLNTSGVSIRSMFLFWADAFDIFDVAATYNLSSGVIGLGVVLDANPGFFTGTHRLFACNSWQTTAAAIFYVLFAAGTSFSGVGSGVGTAARAIFSTDVDPLNNIIAPIGSLALRSAGGGAGTTLYVKEADTGAATGWVGK